MWGTSIIRNIETFRLFINTSLKEMVEAVIVTERERECVCEKEIIWQLTTSFDCLCHHFQTPISLVPLIVIFKKVNVSLQHVCCFVICILSLGVISLKRTISSIIWCKWKLLTVRKFVLFTLTFSKMISTVIGFNWLSIVFFKKWLFSSFSCTEWLNVYGRQAFICLDYWGSQTKTATMFFPTS